MVAKSFRPSFYCVTLVSKIDVAVYRFFDGDAAHPKQKRDTLIIEHTPIKERNAIASIEQATQMGGI